MFKRLKLRINQTLCEHPLEENVRIPLDNGIVLVRRRCGVCQKHTSPGVEFKDQFQYNRSVVRNGKTWIEAQR